MGLGQFRGLSKTFWPPVTTDHFNRLWRPGLLDLNEVNLKFGLICVCNSTKQCSCLGERRSYCDPFLSNTVVFNSLIDVFFFYVFSFVFSLP